MTMKTEKYKVSQELMNDINEWRYGVHRLVVGGDINFGQLSSIYNWWIDNDQGISEKNNRLIALIQYVNGEDVFEVEKPKKWIVRSKQRTYDNDYKVVTLSDDNGYITSYLENVATMRSDYGLRYAFKFDTKEEAEKWANPLMEVVEVDW